MNEGPIHTSNLHGPHILCSQCASPFLLFRPFSELLGFEEQDILLVTQVVPCHRLPTGVLVARVTGVLVARAMPMAELQCLSLDLGLTLLPHGVATMLLVKGYVNRSGNNCE